MPSAWAREGRKHVAVRRLSEVGVPHRRVQRLVAEQAADLGQRDAGLQQPGRVGVVEVVDPDVPDLCRVDGGLPDPLAPVVDVLGGAAVCEDEIGAEQP